MPVPDITVLYAGILGLMSVGLGSAAGIYRGKNSIELGDGGDPEMAMRMRRHANFIEYVPLALILIALLEMQAVTAWAIHGLCATLIVGRAMHWYAFSDGVKSAIRGIGAGLTVLPIIIASIWCIIEGLPLG